MSLYGLGGRKWCSLQRCLALLMAVALMAASCGSESPSALAFGDNSVETIDEAEGNSGGGKALIDGFAEAAETPQVSAPSEIIAPDTPVEAVATWVATATDDVTHLVAYDAPGGDVFPFEFAVPNPHQFGSPQVLMVTQGNPGDAWVQVQLPIRPNGQTGWIDASLYEFSQTMVRAEVNLSSRTVIVYDGTEILAQTRAVIGSPATPTPLGTYFITAKRRNPPSESYIGPWGLALSAFSEVHETFGGGLPVIAIHGTNRPDQVGDARSNGCIRIPNDVVTFLAEHVPLGAPVTITA